MSNAVKKNSSKDKPVTIVLVRHGRTPTTGKINPGQKKGIHLSEDGIRQAQLTAEAVAARWNSVAGIFTSPLERAKETALPIAKRFETKPKVLKRVIEADIGDWTGSSLDSLASKSEWKTIQQNPSSFRFPGGESFVEMQARMVDAINDLVHQNDFKGKTLVVVSHADLIKLALTSALGMPLDLFHRLSIDPCSISVINFTSNGPQVVAVNETSHLDSM